MSYTVEQVSGALGCHSGTIHNYIRRGIVKPEKKNENGVEKYRINIFEIGVIWKTLQERGCADGCSNKIKIRREIWEYLSQQAPQRL